VRQARVALALQAALAALAAGTLGLALVAAASTMSLRASSAEALALACARFALPDVSLESVLALSLGSLAMAVFFLTARSLARQAVATRRFITELQVTGAGPHSSLVFAADSPQAFCAGLLRPRVYVSDAALATLDRAELTAVIAHEAHHRRVLDPLRVAIARAISDGLFFLPVTRRLTDRYRALAELAADSAAVRATGAEPLASALLRFERADPAVVGIAPERVDHLLGARPAWELSLALVAWSVAVLTAIGALALRLADAAASPLDLPLVAAQSCMLLMAILPLMLGASAILGARSLARRLPG
jgi:Zn-dependent protease with chaperone function